MKPPKKPIKVFISYSHDNEEHGQRVRALSDRLRIDGIDCRIDQYEVAPPKGWRRWMEDQIKWADFVLMVCSETYHRRVQGREKTGQGLGATYEATLLLDQLYESGMRNSRTIPLLFAGAETTQIPLPLRTYTCYYLDANDEAYEEQYQALYRHLTGQPRIEAPPLGKALELESAPPHSSMEVTKRQPWAIGMVAIVFICALWVWHLNLPEPMDKPVMDILQYLEGSGYLANHALLPLEPGDVLQVRESDPPSRDGSSRQLETPILTLRAAECFPELRPGPTTAWQPANNRPPQNLEITIAGIHWTVEDLHTTSTPKLDLSGHFSKSCVDKMHRAFAAGDPLEWFETVVETVFVARNSENATTSTELATPLVLAYRSRPMQLEPAMPDEEHNQPQTSVTAMVAASQESMLPSLISESEASAEDLRDVFLDKEAERFVGRLALQAQQGEDSWERVSIRHVFLTGERFRFEIETTQRAVLSIFHQKPGSESLVDLWPVDSGHPNGIESREAKLVPPPPAFFEMEGKGGEETFFIALADPSQIPGRDKPFENFVLRGLDQANTRGLTDTEEHWIYFETENNSAYLATLAFRLRHSAVR